MLPLLHYNLRAFISRGMNEKIKSPLINKHAPSFRARTLDPDSNRDCYVHQLTSAVTNLSKLLDLSCLSFLISVGEGELIGDNPVLTSEGVVSV